MVLVSHIREKQSMPTQWALSPLAFLSTHENTCQVDEYHIENIGLYRHHKADMSILTK